MNKNRIAGGVGQGERAHIREALATKDQTTYIRRLRGESHGTLTWGDLASHPKG